MKIKPAKGFSIIELLIVITILATLLSMAVPTFNRYRDNTILREAAGEISGDIQLYKQTAVSENRGYRINFDASVNTYTIRRETALNSGTYTDVMTKNIGAGNANILIDSTTGFNSGTFITFNPRGTTSNCGSVCAVKLKHNTRGATATITTTLMGKVSVTYVL